MKQLKQLLINQTGVEGAISSVNLNQLTLNLSNTQDSVRFNKTLLDYDYGEEDEESEKVTDSMTSHLPNVLEVHLF